jgi:DNA-binding NarL/FixJ family response regulator
MLVERLTEAIRQIPAIDLVGTADTEASAIAFARQQAIDVIILDLQLKRGTGFGVMRALNSAPWRPRILVVMTNYDLPEYKHAALALGATHFFDKLRDYDRLPELIKEVSAEHSPTP